MTGIIPLAGVQLFDKDASPVAFLNGGIVDIWLATTTTPAPIFSDFGLTVPLANPFTLNAAGRFNAVYVADGAYRVRVRNSSLVLQFDDDEVAAITAAISTTPIVVTPQQLWATGHVLTRFDDQPYDGFVRANGRTIGSPTSGGSERANADCQPLFLFLWGFANVSVVTGKGASAAADWSANKQLTLPDFAGRLIGARDDLGNGAAGRITGATVTGPTVVGAVGGAQTVVLDATMIPPHTHAATVTDPGHTHALSETVYAAGAASPAAGAGGALLKAVTATSSVTGVTVANASVGGGLAHSNMPPVMLFTVYLKL